MIDELKPKERFSEAAEFYDKARPGYPGEVIDFILQHCQLKKGALLVDVGSGTGISSRAFARRGLKVIGIEPNSAMRDQAQSANTDIDFEPPNYQYGSAEQTSLPDQCADAVLAAQAFHWFDVEKTFTEFVRILKPNGWVILLWNQRNESDPFTKSYSDLLVQYGDGKKEVRSELRQMEGGDKLINSELFTKAEKFVFANEQHLNEAGLIDRALSVSYAPKEKEPKEILIKNLSNLFNQEQKNGTITLKYNLEVFLARCSK